MILLLILTAGCLLQLRIVLPIPQSADSAHSIKTGIAHLIISTRRVRLSLQGNSPQRPDPTFGLHQILLCHGIVVAF